MILTVDEIVKETDSAILVKCGDETAWLPRSQIECAGNYQSGFCEIEIPQWLAEEKGLEGYCEE